MHLNRTRKLIDDLTCLFASGIRARTLYRNERTLAAFYARLIKRPRRLAFDVGANQGEYTKALAAIFEKVVCFEPQQDLAENLKITASRIPNILVINKAISDSNGQGKISVSQNRAMSSMESNWIKKVKKSKRFGNNSWNKTQKIELITLKQAFKTYGTPEFLKVDVEGHEAKVFKTLNHPIREICFECTPEARLAAIDVIEKISSIGNYSFRIQENGFVPFKIKKKKPLSLSETKKNIMAKEFQAPMYYDIFASLF